MESRDMLHLQDALSLALQNLSGVRQALGHVTDGSTDYDMCQMLSNVVSGEIERIVAGMPEDWKTPALIS